jgi:hypothetical protein
LPIGGARVDEDLHRSRKPFFEWAVPQGAKRKAWRLLAMATLFIMRTLMRTKD